MTYSGKDKYKGGYFVKKRLNRYKERQQGCSTAQRRIMDKKNCSKINDVEKEQDNRQSMLWQPLNTKSNNHINK